MRKSNLLAVFTAVTMAMTMAVTVVMPANVTKAAEKVNEAATTVEGRCGDTANYSYNSATKTLTISGTGDMWDDTGLDKTMKSAKTIIVEKGITSIGNNSFYLIKNVEKVEIADTVKTIKSYAFGNINGTFTIPASVTKMEPFAINTAKKIIVKGKMDNYQYAAFGEGAEIIEIGGTANNLGYAMAAIDEDTDNTVTIAKNNNACRMSSGCLMSADGKTVYYYTSDNTEVKIPDSVLTIKPAAFYRKYITKVKLGKNVSTIGEYAFAESRLSELVANTQLRKIGRYAFSNTELSEVTLKSKVTMYPKAFDAFVKIYTTKSFKNSKTVVTRAKYQGKKLSISFCKVAGAKGYQVQIKKGRKKYRYTAKKNTIRIKTPKALKNTYNVKYSYDINKYTGKVEGKPAYVTVRPYKLNKKKKKSYGNWSSKFILTK